MLVCGEVCGEVGGGEGGGGGEEEGTVLWHLREKERPERGEHTAMITGNQNEAGVKLCNMSAF